MKRSLSCSDMGITNCTFEVRSEKNEEIKDALMFHAQKVHPEIVVNLSEKEKKQMFEQMDKIIK